MKFRNITGSKTSPSCDGAVNDFLQMVIVTVVKSMMMTVVKHYPLGFLFPPGH